jgi:FAD/FMN-containing dehydrogenase
VNYLEDDAVDPAAVAYGTNLARLREIKTKWDPRNVFRRNVNIPPSTT